MSKRDARPRGKHGVPLGRRPIYPFHELTHVGDSFLVVGGKLHNVQGSGNGHLSRHSDENRKLAYYRCEAGILVILVQTSDNQGRRMVHLDDSHGFIEVDRVMNISGKLEGTVNLTKNGHALARTIAPLDDKQYAEFYNQYFGPSDETLSPEELEEIKF